MTLHFGPNHNVRSLACARNMLWEINFLVFVVDAKDSSVFGRESKGRLLACTNKVVAQCCNGRCWWPFALVSFLDELLESQFNVGENRVVPPVVTTLFKRIRTVD